MPEFLFKTADHIQDGRYPVSGFVSLFEVSLFVLVFGELISNARRKYLEQVSGAPMYFYLYAPNFCQAHCLPSMYLSFNTPT
jgi:hypothetical protein